MSDHERLMVAVGVTIISACWFIFPLLVNVLT